MTGQLRGVSVLYVEIVHLRRRAFPNQENNFEEENSSVEKRTTGAIGHRGPANYSLVSAAAATKSINCCTPWRSSLVFSLNEIPIP